MNTLTQWREVCRVPIIFVMSSSGGNHVNLHWTWHAAADSINSSLQTCQLIVGQIKQDAPPYLHKSQATSCVGEVGSDNTLNEEIHAVDMYIEILWGSVSCSNDQPGTQKLVLGYRYTFFDLEELYTMFDLRNVYSGNKSMFGLFWVCKGPWVLRGGRMLELSLMIYDTLT